MKRHCGSKQKPVPKLAVVAGPSNFSFVIGTTVLLKSCAGMTVGNANGNGLGETFWAGADWDRDEHAIKSGMTLRKIIRHHRGLGRIGPDALHAPHQRVRAEDKGVSRF